MGAKIDEEGAGEIKSDLLDGAITDELRIGRSRTLRMLDSYYLSVYLTLMSIIQGVALGGLIWTTKTLLDNNELLRSSNELTFMLWLQLLINFLLITYIWYAYVGAGLLYKWVPSYLEALTPFVIGLLEAAVIVAVGNLFWWFILLGIISVAGAAEHYNMFSHLREHWYESADDWKAQRKWQRNRVILHPVIAALFVFCAVLSKYSPVSHFLVLIPLIIVLYLILSWRKIWMETVQVRYGIY